jgi:HlyD family secretion protein
LNATTVQNVVTYNTVIDFNNPERKLLPGMTAYISIPVANADDVLRVPNGALRYKPDLTAEEIRALYQKYGLSHGPSGGAAETASSEANPRRTRPEGTQGGGSGENNNAAKAQRTPRMDVSVVWKLHPDKSLEPVRIRMGITDHTVTEVAQVLNGNLQPGDELITGSISKSSTSRAPGVGGQQRR